MATGPDRIISTVIPIIAGWASTRKPAADTGIGRAGAGTNHSRIQIGERCAMGAGSTRPWTCAESRKWLKTGVELCPFEHVPFRCIKIDPADQL